MDVRILMQHCGKLILDGCRRAGAERVPKIWRLPGLSLFSVVAIIAGNGLLFIYEVVTRGLALSFFAVEVSLW